MVFQQVILLKHRCKASVCVNLLAFYGGLNARKFFGKTASRWLGDVQLQCVLVLLSNLAGLRSIFDVRKQYFVAGFNVPMKRLGQPGPIEQIDQDWDVAFTYFLL
jgi:hypothetical protein